MALIGIIEVTIYVYYSYITNYIFNIYRCSLSSGSLACFDIDGKLNILSLIKANKDSLNVETNGDQIKSIPGSPIPAFIVTNKNVEKLIYIKDNKVYTRVLILRASLYIYTYMADRHILLQISSPAQVCNIQFYNSSFFFIKIKINSNNKYIIV